MRSSRSSSRKERAQRAVDAMKPLGFSTKLCGDVLNRLLKLYYCNWSLIEDENYSVLLEALLTAAKAKVKGDPEPEQDEMDAFPAQGHPSTSLAAATREDALGPPSPQQAPRALKTSLGKRRHIQTIDEELEDAVFTREAKHKPVDMDASRCQDVQPGMISSSRRDVASLSTRSALNNGTGSGAGNTQEAPGLEIDVASSAAGEVKLSMKISVEPSKFRMPSLEGVFKMVKDKCLGSCKALPPVFSVSALMTEICQCVLQLGTEHTVEHNSRSDILGDGSRSEDDRNKKRKAAENLLVSNGLESGPVNSIPAQQQHLALSTLRTNHDVKDISKGEEKIRISIVNESGRENCPPAFFYIPRNVVFLNANVDISLAKIGGEDCCADCYGNCLSAPEPCACARETGGEYAYTVEGLVRPAFIDECVSVNRFPEEHQKVFCQTCPRERSRNKASPEPCRGHLFRKFIKECWSKCGCNMQCSNRVVQRGITCNLQVFFRGKGAGWGLRTLDELPKGAFVCEYAGEILTTTELHERVVENMQNDRYAHPILLDADWWSEGVLKDEEALCLDGTFYGNVGRFINHRCCDANLVVVPVEVESPNHHYYHFAFFTSTKVAAFEELTWDYGIDFEDEKQPMKPFECLCGSRYCRGRRRHHRGREA